MDLARKALKAGKYKSALDLARGAENYDASKKAEVNAFIDQVFVAIEGKRVEAEEQRKKAELQRQKAEAAERQSEISRKIADEEQQKSEIARIEALTQKEIAENLLDSLGKFSGREDALLKFNAFKERGDHFIKEHEWDSAYLNLTSALKIADENPLIKVGKIEIYANIEKSSININNKSKVIAESLKGDSLADTGGLKNYWNAFRLYHQLDTNYIKNKNKYIDKLILSIDSCLNIEITNCCKLEERMALKYFLLELNIYRHNSNIIDSISMQLSNEKIASRRQIEKSYFEHSMTMSYHQQFEKIMSKRNFLYKVFVAGGTSKSPITIRGAYSFTFFNSNKNLQFGKGVDFRNGYDSKKAKYLIKGLNNRVYMTNNFSYAYRQNEITSVCYGTFLYNYGGSLTTLFDTEKQNLSKNTRFSLVYGTRATYAFQRGASLSFGAGISCSYVKESFRHTQNIYYTDTTVLRQNTIRTSFVSLIGLPRTTAKFLAMGTELELFLSLESVLGKYRKNVRDKIAVDIGIRLATDFYLYTSKNKSFYKEIKDQYGIIGGNKLALGEIFVGLRGPFNY